MAWLDRLRHTIFGSDAADDFDREAAFHLARRVEENIARGLSPADARIEARRRFGSAILSRERTRDEDTLPWLADVGHDLRYAARALWKTPTFTAGTIVAIALGIGANVAVFSVVNAVLLRPLPYPDPDRLVTLGYTWQRTWVSRMSPAKFVIWQRDARPFAQVAAYRQQTIGFRHTGDAEPLDAVAVTADFFPLFGARAAAGRLFSPADDRAGSPLTAVLSHSAWLQSFNGDPGVLGAAVTIDGAPATVIGVLDPSFEAPLSSGSARLWLPLRLDPESADQPPSLLAAGRLAPGISLTAANRQARLAAERFHERFPDAMAPDDTFQVAPFREALVGQSRRAVLVLMGAVGFVLLIACANVATLLLVRASSRQREIALRSALGAGRGRVARLLMAEAFLLAAVGGVAGLAIGLAGFQLLSNAARVELPLLGPHAALPWPDWRVLAFTGLALTITCIVCGLAPVLHVLRSDLRSSLAAAPIGTTPLTHASRLRSGLVAGQIAIALILLVGAALLLRSVVVLRTVERGFTSNDVLTLEVLPSSTAQRTGASVSRQVTTGVERLQSVPGVIAAAATCCLPLASDWKTSIQVEDRERGASSILSLVSYRIVSPQYFDVLGIPVVRGRVFTERDVHGAPAVALVNEAMARRYWPDADPLADRVQLFPGPAPTDEPHRQVVGIVGDALDGLLMNPTEQPTVYVPVAQLLDREVSGWPLAWLVRTQALTPHLTQAAREAVRQASDGQAIARTVALDAWVREADGPARTNALVFAGFAFTAFGLALLGVFAVMASVVQHRTPELGIRVALGARAGQVQRLLLGYGARLIVCGVGVGLGVSAVLSRMLTALLFRVQPLDVTAFVVASACIAIAGLLAAWWPTRRAATIEPTVWLRTE